MFKNISKFIYTLKHKRAFLKVEKQLTGHNTLRGYLHDIDKLFMYLCMPTGWAHKLHTKLARHHDNSRTKTKEDYLEMIIDWECARLTKPDKPLNAVDTLKKYYPHLTVKVDPLLVEVGLKKHTDLFEKIWGYL